MNPGERNALEAEALAASGRDGPLWSPTGRQAALASRVDVVGHFGSRFSYATHAVELARALQEEGILGRCVNLDDSVLEDYMFLYPHLPDDAGVYVGMDLASHGNVAFIISAPTESIRAFADAYEIAALFVCPNTNRLSAEAIETLKRFAGRHIVPSQYCSHVLMGRAWHEPEADSSAPEPACFFSSPAILPLGVHSIFVEGRRTVRERRVARRNRNEAQHVVHFTSDGYWPGRKGTQELIEAWPDIQSETGARLTIHCTAPMRDSIYFYCADRGLYEPDVRVVSGASPRGVLPHELFEQMANADLIVHPSRAEGYGMIGLAALAAGVTIAMTAATGELDYVRTLLRVPGYDAPDTFANRSHRWANVFEIGHGDLGPLAGEEGAVPEVSPHAIRESVIEALRTALAPLDAGAWAVAHNATWESTTRSWVAYGQDMLLRARKSLGEKET